MLPHPLHPAIVHFPIVLAVLAPVVAAAGVWAIHTGRIRTAAWVVVLVLQACVVGSGLLALETGQDEEETVERVVSERAIEEHEEAAERFLLLAGLTLPFAAAGLLRSPLGGVARALTVAGTVAAAVAVGITGHHGGELVYTHGAASAYLDATPGSPPVGRPAALHDDD